MNVLLHMLSDVDWMALCRTGDWGSPHSTCVNCGLELMWSDGAWRHLAHGKACHSSVFCGHDVPCGDKTPMAYPEFMIESGVMNVWDERSA